jgi:hypothetical protein
MLAWRLRQVALGLQSVPRIDRGIDPLVSAM